MRTHPLQLRIITLHIGQITVQFLQQLVFINLVEKFTLILEAFAYEIIYTNVVFKVKKWDFRSLLH